MKHVVTRTKFRHSLSVGERKRLVAYGFMALFGAAISYVTMLSLGGGSRPLQFPPTYEVWMVICGAVGAMAALRLGQHRFGRAGKAGAAHALRGVVWVTFIAAIIAGTLALPFYGTMFGPFTLGLTFAYSPLLGLSWVINLVAAHLLLSAWQAERDSIFNPIKPAR